MQTPQHRKTRCLVYLHPAAITSPGAVQAIQQRTGLLVIVNTGRPVTANPSSSAAIDDTCHWGGDAA